MNNRRLAATLSAAAVLATGCATHPPGASGALSSPSSVARPPVAATTTSSPAPTPPPATQPTEPSRPDTSPSTSAPELPSEIGWDGELRWNQVPLFTFPASRHRLSFRVSEPIPDHASLSLRSQTGGPSTAELDPETQLWSATLAAPPAGVWDVEAQISSAGQTQTIATTHIPVATAGAAGETLTISDRQPALLATIPWGTNDTSVGLHSPSEGQTDAPSGIVHMPRTGELVIVDRVNRRLLVTDALAQPVRAIALPIEGFVSDAAALPDGRVIVAEFRSASGAAFALAHTVDVATGAVESSLPAAVPVLADGVGLRYDDRTELVLAEFGDPYPFYDTRTGAFTPSGTPVDAWYGLVRAPNQAGIKSGPDYLAATFPLGPTVEGVELGTSAAWALVTGIGDGEQIHAWLVRYNLDGSSVTGVEVPLPRLWTAASPFAVRDRDVVLMVRTDSGLDLYSVDLPEP